MAERRWIKIGAGRAATITTILAFFALLSYYYDFKIIDLTGDIICEGTYANPCISKFEVKNQNAIYVDVYNENEVKLNFSPEIEDYALFVPDGRCSATGSCRCELKNGKKIGFEDWRCVDFTNKTKPRQDKKYNFRFPAYSTTEFLLAGIKEKPSDTVKWGFEVNEENLDPIWEGINNSKKTETDSTFKQYGSNFINVKTTNECANVTTSIKLNSTLSLTCNDFFSIDGNLAQCHFQEEPIVNATKIEDNLIFSQFFEYAYAKNQTIYWYNITYENTKGEICKKPVKYQFDDLKLNFEECDMNCRLDNNILSCDDCNDGNCDGKLQSGESGVVVDLTDSDWKTEFDNFRTDTLDVKKRVTECLKK